LKPESSNIRLEEASAGTEEERWDLFRVLARLGAKPRVWACNEFGLRMFAMEQADKTRWEGPVPYTCRVTWVETDTGVRLKDVRFLPAKVTVGDSLFLDMPHLFTEDPRRSLDSES
jgi:hypothetical protein